ncbi:MAG: LysM peptidoglycan-binding domain-containing protein, partial [Anaerolineaceae bacterium]|nr:LysM peptidoglycan-binding domain-containing protein [Anaerolineaceae bacterium]
DKSFTIRETNAMVWVDTDVDYLIEEVWRKNQTSVRVIFDQEVRQAGIGIADSPDKHRYIVLTVAGLDDGSDDYSMIRPTYDYRTPKPTVSATPSPQPLVTSTMNPDGGVYHVVKEGETFSEIALAYGLDWWTLSVLNHIKLNDTTPVVIMEGQVLVIEPTYTLTPTPTATKTPVPPTRTPRPTFTTDSNALPSRPAQTRLPAPDVNRLLTRMVGWKRPVGWILVAVCVPGIYFAIRKK